MDVASSGGWLHRRSGCWEGGSRVKINAMQVDVTRLEDWCRW